MGISVGKPSADRYGDATVIGVVITANTVCMVAFFMLSPLLTIHLERDGASQLMIGLVATIWSLAVLICGPFYLGAMRRLGVLGAMTTGLVATGLLILLYPILPIAPVWLGLGFLIGAGYGLFWVASESWLNAAAPPAWRSRVTALYAMTLGIGASGGPMILDLVGTEGTWPFLIMGGLFAIGVIPLLLLRRITPAFDGSERSGGLLSMARAAPLVVIIGCAAGFADVGLPAMFTAFSLASGTSAAGALDLLFWLGLGRLCLQLPLGFLADRFDRRLVLGIAAVLCGTIAASLPFVLGSAAAYPVMVLWGGCIDGFYAIGLAIIGERFARDRLAAANTLYVMTHSVGSFASAPLIGQAMDMSGPIGYPVVITMFCIITAFATLGSFVRDRRS